jgi:hypothetical protein
MLKPCTPLGALLSWIKKLFEIAGEGTGGGVRTTVSLYAGAVKLGRAAVAVAPRGCWL